MTESGNSKKTKIEGARRRLLGLRPVSVVSWRDAVATLLPILLLSAAAIYATLHFVRPAPPRHLVMAGGPDGSNFRNIAERYRQILARNGIELSIVATHGSAENLDLLAENRVDIALVQSGVTRKDGTDEIVSLGTMFRQPVTIFYRTPKPITRLSELDGLRIAVGHEGSGTRVLAITLLDGNGIEPGGRTQFLDLEGGEAAQALLDRRIDAAFLSGDSANLGAVRRLLHADGIRLFDFVQGEAYERRYRYLNRFELPAGAFDLGANLPDHRITMLAPTVELLAHADLHPALSDLLVEAGQEVHGRGSLMQNPGEFPHAIEHDYPMSEDAARYYKSGKSLAYRYLPFWLASLVNRVALVLVPIIVVLIPACASRPTSTAGAFAVASTGTTAS
ncbi:TAXI family TRAP transporter solute-binding subunit [Solimonas soli]|uniref:TAXI family TRAP transporter solute-binding subunit n=1 Tax=Solimonas soli TaxID=413479 RepID=UPI0004BC2055|nr:TAXI family TRAP transporter solute-binding subunit [Solimonas soli]